jgi:outer membrane lipoprotein carrier protein
MDSGRFLRRRLRSLIRHALLVSVIAAGSVAAQPTESSGSARGYATIEGFLAEVRSLTADFRQELYNSDQELSQTETGTLSLERPNRFRWNYVDPTELTVVADGSRLWIYDVELEQVTVAPFDDSLASSPAMLLSGDRNVREEFEIVQTYTFEGLDWVKLAPIAGGSDFISVSIGFRGTEPHRLELVDGLNQVTRIELTNLVVNPKLDGALFELEVPPGVDVIGAEG